MQVFESVKDPFQYDRYLRSNQFLKDINNDGEDKNNLYRQNLISLEKFVMVKFEFDVTGNPLLSIFLFFIPF